MLGFRFISIVVIGQALGNGCSIYVFKQSSSAGFRVCELRLEVGFRWCRIVMDYSMLIVSFGAGGVVMSS